MAESFGDRLRRRREQQGIALATVAEQTKIKASLLEALEREDFSHWPSGFFGRAFMRAYAEAIGVDPDTVVRECVQSHPELVESLTPSAAAPAATRDAASASGPSSRIREMVEFAARSLSDRLTRRAPEPAAPGLQKAPVVSTALAPTDPDFQAVAQLCTRIAKAGNDDEVAPLLGEAARILDATGVIIWIWDEASSELRPGFAHGYPPKVLAHVPAVKRDAANATAAAFRSGQPCCINSSARARGALVVPLLTSSGCVGVLAAELPSGSEQAAPIRAVATILAAQLAQFIMGSTSENRHFVISRASGPLGPSEEMAHARP
jgi:transcriptional regulator with XRE-family HTH domain